jgi:putative DNA primase/helicase
MTDQQKKTAEAIVAEHMPPRLEVPGASDPMGVARKLLVEYRRGDDLTLRHWRGGWMRWNHTCWIEDEDRAIRAWLYETLDAAEYQWYNSETKTDELMPWRPNRKKIADVLDALAATIHLSEIIDPPAWLDDSVTPAGEVVACTNGLLHVGTRTLHQLTPRYFNRVAVPFDWDPAAPPPKRWLEFLSQLWPGDPDSIAALQQFFGYVLSGRTDLHKILLLIGPTRAGKGVLARVLAALVGKGNVAGPTLASLGTNFGLAPLLGKPLAVVSDARLGGQNVHQVVERLLSISGEDTLSVDRKYRDQWTGKLPSRFLILSNELPRFGDASGAIAHRFIVLTLTHSWLGKENPKLTEQLLTEPSSSNDAIIALQDLVSPVAAFVRDRCTTGAGLEVPVSELYSKWKTWCEDNGRDKPGTVQTFGRDLRAVVPTLRVHRPRDGDVRLPRRYVGVELSGTHNGDDRGPSRSSEPDDPPDNRLDRDGPRSHPLWAPPNEPAPPTRAGHGWDTSTAEGGCGCDPPCGEDGLYDPLCRYLPPPSAPADPLVAAVEPSGNGESIADQAWQAIASGYDK